MKRTAWSTTIRWMLAALWLVLLTACSSSGHGGAIAAPHALPTLPTYPGAYDLHRQTQPVGQYNGVRTTFQTSDSPTQVVQFFSDQLLAQGWQPRPNHRADSLNLMDQRSCPYYGLSLYIEPASTPTQFVLVLAEIPCPTPQP